MRGWNRATILFISTAAELEPGGVEERWFAVAQELMELGASVRLRAPLNADVVKRAHEVGIQVDPYMLDKWNVVRTRSRLRKYLKRYRPSVVHSTGAEADALLRWAARRVPGMRVVHTLRSTPTKGIRRTLVIAVRRLAELNLASVRFVFAETEQRLDEARAAGLSDDRIALDPPARDSAALAECVRMHVDLYWRLISE